MADKSEVLALAGALVRADVLGPFYLQLDAGGVLCVVAAIQFARRDPAAGDTLVVRQAVTLARKLCAEVAHREPELYRFMNRGWADPGEGGRE